MPWRRPGNKPLYEPMIFSLPTQFTRAAKCWSAHEMAILVLISRVARNEGSKHQNNTLDRKIFCNMLTQRSFYA